MAIKKVCPRCRRVIETSQRLCVECTARMNRDYDRVGRDKDSEAFYKSKEWLTVRGKVLSTYHGLDLYQLKVNKRIVYADTVHHIEELKDAPSRALDLDNLIPLSGGTHSMIHKLYKKDKKRTQELLFKLLV